MEIGRRIYFEKITGNIIVDTGERSGLVFETSIEEDFSSYIALAERVPESVGFLQLEYAQFMQDFFECNGYRVHQTEEEFEITLEALSSMQFRPSDQKYRYGCSYKEVKIGNLVLSNDQFSVNPNGVVTLKFEPEIIENTQDLVVYMLGVKHSYIQFSYPDPTQPHLPPEYRKPLSEELEEAKKVALDAQEAVLEVYEMILQMQTT